jgi:crossover junction endodeoxyribonuclease RuvC
MPKPKTKILAIDPGTREIGVALLQNGDLIYHGVKTIRKRGTPQERLKEGRWIVLRLINDFKPEVLAVEKTFFAKSKSAPLLNVFADEIQAIGKQQRKAVVSFAPNTVKKFICGNGHASKAEVARVVISRFPELKVFLTQDRAWKERYHQNMFDAVALGICCSARTVGRIK